MSTACGVVADGACQIVFVDVMDSIIEQLQKQPSYTVTEIGAKGVKVNTITNYRAINSKTHEADVIEEIAKAEVVRILRSHPPCGQSIPPTQSQGLWK
jgi:mannitol-1-phosphate/altronate dehydrogenase